LASPSRASETGRASLAAQPALAKVSADVSLDTRPRVTGPSFERETLQELRSAIESLASAIRELNRRCDEALRLFERLVDDRVAMSSGAAAPSRPESLLLAETGPAAGVSSSRFPADLSLDERQGALLVAITTRGGTLADASFSALAAELGLTPDDVDQLFGGPEPHLVRRKDGAAGLTESGLEAAVKWRRLLPDELLRAATDLQREDV
jgi:hypothetical protein